MVVLLAVVSVLKMAVTMVEMTVGLKASIVAGDLVDLMVEWLVVLLVELKEIVKVVSLVFLMVYSMENQLAEMKDI